MGFILGKQVKLPGGYGASANFEGDQKHYLARRYSVAVPEDLKKPEMLREC